MSHSQDDEFIAPLEKDTSEPVIYDFTVTLDDPLSIQADRQRSYRKAMLWLVGGLFGLLAVVALVIRLVAPEFYLSGPQRTIHQYFDALGSQNYSAAFELIEPGTMGITEFQQQAADTINRFITWKINCSWSFTEMKFQTLNQDEDAARVRADGFLKIVDNQTGRFMRLPYSDELQLVKRNHAWYIRP